jgi:hypothetical protein
MIKRLSLFAITALCAGTLAFPQTANASILIDNFSAGQTLSQFGMGTNSQITFSNSVFGGERVDTVNVRDLGGDEFFGVLGFGGDFSIGQGANDRIHGSLLYNNSKNFDMTEGGLNDHFVFTFSSNDLDSELAKVLQLAVTSNGTRQIVDITIPQSSSLPSAVQLGFSDFNMIDFTQVDSISLNFDFEGLLSVCSGRQLWMKTTKTLMLEELYLTGDSLELMLTQ